MKNLLIPLAFLAGPALADPIECLQQNIYFESRNQPIVGMFAVGWVTVNRVDDEFYPDTVCDVVWQDNQFSWTNDGKPDTPSDNVLEQEKWKLSGQVAKVVYREWKEGLYDPFEGAVMFHADYVEPYWTDAYELVLVVGDHLFYRNAG